MPLITKIELSADDARLFVEFRRHQDLFQKLVNCGAFNVRGGRVELEFDGDGNLREVKRRDTLLRA